MNTQHGVYIGRFNPIHKGHEAVIRKMFNVCGAENSLIVIGSCNNQFSLRHFFSYEERGQFIRSIFSEARIVGLPDYGSDAIWLLALDDILKLAGIDPCQATYFGGCEEDVRFFLDDGRNCFILDRFEGDQIGLSATRVRDCLIHQRVDELKELVSPCAIDLIVNNFTQKWEEFKRL